MIWITSYLRPDLSKCEPPRALCDRYKFELSMCMFAITIKNCPDMDNLTKSDNISLMKSFNTTLIRNDDHIFSWSNVIMPFLVLWYFGFIIKMIIKYKDKLEPSHIIELNAMLDVLILNICRLLQTWDPNAFENNWFWYCWVNNFVAYFARVLLHVNIAAAEVNRSLFVHLGSQYFSYFRKAISSHG